MPGLSPLEIAGIAAVAALVAGWLAVSFLPPGPARVRTAWLSATALYVALASLFVGLFLRAREGGSLAGTLAFGFLMGVFLAGVVLAAIRTAGSFRSRRAGGAHATH